MALKSTIFKADVQISDMDRHYYANHQLTIARHPSETDERMMMRVLAFVIHASESLSFGKGLSSDEEPDLWQKDLTGAIDLWVEVGLPDEKRILKACGRSAKVIVYTYASNSAIWWKGIGNRIERAKNLAVININADTSLELSKLAQRNMQIQCTIQDGALWFSAGEQSVHVELATLKANA